MALRSDARVLAECDALAVSSILLRRGEDVLQELTPCVVVSEEHDAGALLRIAPALT